jgi:hypothetical protein
MRQCKVFAPGSQNRAAVQSRRDSAKLDWQRAYSGSAKIDRQRKVTPAAQPVYLSLGRWWKCRGRRGLGQKGLALGDVQDDVETRFANELGDRCGVEARGVVFNPQCARGAIEAELPNPVDVSRVGQRYGHLFRGRRRVVVKNFHRGHAARITACNRF